MRDMIEVKLFQMWAWHGDERSRWYPVREMIVRIMGTDPMTKAGKKVVAALKLDSEECRNAVRNMDDVDLVDLFQLTVARFYQQRG